MFKFLSTLAFLVLAACTGSTGGGDSNGDVTDGHDPDSTGSGFITGDAYMLDQPVETEVNIDGVWEGLTGDIIPVSAGSHEVTFGSTEDLTIDDLPTTVQLGLLWATPMQTKAVKATTDATDASLVEADLNRALGTTYECSQQPHSWDSTKTDYLGEPMGDPYIDDPQGIYLYEGRYLRGLVDNQFGGTGNNGDTWEVVGTTLVYTSGDPNLKATEGMVNADDSFSYILYSEVLERVTLIICLPD